MPPDPTHLHFHVMAKPAGPICNLDCTYCFYLEKKNLHPKGHVFQMSDEVLEAYVKQYIASQRAPEVNFAWQGGEPLLMGVNFFRKAVEFQRAYADGKRITNSLQTNGVLLDDEWCAFLAGNNFLIGVSIDGPRELHDRYRVDRRGQPTFDRVIEGVERMKRFNVDFNTLTVINRANAAEPLAVYRFLKEIGSTFHQFIPLVERIPDPETDDPRLDLAGPPPLKREGAGDPGDAKTDRSAGATPLPARVTDWSVDAVSYGRFMNAIFDEWVRHDVGTIFVQLFDEALAAWYQGEATLCIFRETCGGNVIIEHDGAIYPCDHFVYPDLRLGNIQERPIADLVRSPEQIRFGADKRDTLPAYCRRCEFRFACHGGCPKHRFIQTPDGEPGLNYLCAGYKMFFKHAAPHLNTMCELLEQQQPPARIMETFHENATAIPSPSSAPAGVAASRPSPATRPIGRNTPCPCGSGKKYKRCCGK